MSGPFSCNYGDIGDEMPARTPQERLRIFDEKYNKRISSRKRISDSAIEAKRFRGTLNKLENAHDKLALEEYYTILDSYTLDKWNQMPWPLNPITCALKGWECVSPGMVRCSVCRKGCTFDLFSYYEIFPGLSKTDQTMRAWLVEEFITRLSQPGHDEKCSRLPLLRPSLVNQFANFTLSSFRAFLEERLKSLLPICDKLPVVVAEYDEVLTPKNAVLCMAKVSQITDPIVATNTVAIALHGWENILRSDGTDDIVLHCRECRRTVECGKFCTLDRLSILQQNESSHFHPDLFSWPKPEEFRFDCRTEHLSWCPWIRPVTISEEMLAVLSLKSPEKVVGCDVAIAALAADLTSCDRIPGEIGTNFQLAADLFRQNITATHNEMMALQKTLPNNHHV